MEMYSRCEFASALKQVRAPHTNVLRFLNAHYQAPGRTLTATLLAEAARYEDYRGVNLRYGLLAKQVGAVLGQPDATLAMLVEFIRPQAMTNQEWLLVMRPDFAAALKEVGWM